MEDRKLSEILKRNRHTVYGERCGFAGIKSLSDFQKRAPLTRYEDYIPYIEAIGRGEQNILTSEPVLLLEPTSGSTSARKLIPYTRGLRREFASAIGRWLWDLNKNFPRLKYGSLYFSITPQGSVHVSGGEISGVPVGFNDDEEYIGGIIGRLVAGKFCVPSSVKNITDMDEFWRVTSLYIRRAKKLRFVSVWNPTFLLILLEKAGMGGKELFPDLELISCWADGNAAPYAEKLKSAFPGVKIQPKGLLATEAIMTIPIEGLGKRLTNAHFFEFIDGSGDLRRTDELEPGKEYEIVLTTSGGLYRYRIGDIVQYQGDLCFDFVGKSGNVSDYFGEKLNEVQVRTVIGGEGFRLLVPNGDRYTLYAERAEQIDIEAIDRGLRENFHYDYCRRLGQLKRAELVKVEDGERQYIENCLRFGMRLGDIKPLYMSNKEGWVFV